MKAKHDDLVEALDGMFDDHHGELAALLLDQIAALDAKIAQLGARAAELTAAMPAAWGVDADGTTGPAPGPARTPRCCNAVARLAEIPGISDDLARTIIAESGSPGRFPGRGPSEPCVPVVQAHGSSKPRGRCGLGCWHPAFAGLKLAAAGGVYQAGSVPSGMPRSSWWTR